MILVSTRHKRLLAWLNPREDEMAALLAELVRVPTENPPGRNYRACAELLERKLREMGLAFERHDFPAEAGVSSEPSPNLLATYGDGTRTLHFHGHYDVVPAQSPAQPSSP